MTRVREEAGKHGPRHGALTGLSATGGVITSAGAVLASQSAATRAAQRATADSLRARLSTARAEITRLQAENATLRDQAARHLGEERAASHHTYPASPR